MKIFTRTASVIWEGSNPKREGAITTQSAVLKEAPYGAGECQATPLNWKEIVVRYQRPAIWRGIWQVVNTLVPYAALWYLMSLSMGDY